MQVQSNEENNKVTNNYELMDLSIDAINKVKNDNRNVDQVNSDLTNKSDLLNKPKELIDFDVLSHFKENISFPPSLKSFLGRGVFLFLPFVLK